MQGKKEGCAGRLGAHPPWYSVKATTYADIIFHATKLECTITITYCPPMYVLQLYSIYTPILW